MLPCDTYIVKKSQVQRWQIKFETDHVSWESSQEDGKGNAAIARKSTNHRWSPNGRYLLLRVCFDSGSHFGRRCARISWQYGNSSPSPWTRRIFAFLPFHEKKEFRLVNFLMYYALYALCKIILSLLIKQIKCFRLVSVLKILGPIHNFVVKSKTNTKWLDKTFHSVRTSGDQMNFRSGKNKLTFTGYDYYFLSKAHDMLTQGNVTIDRTSHKDLSNVTWIGLITHVVVTKTSEFILFRQETKKIRCKWLPMGDKKSDSLPLNELQSSFQTRYFSVRYKTDRDTDDTDENAMRYRTIYFHFPYGVSTRGYKCTQVHNYVQVRTRTRRGRSDPRDIGSGFRGRVLCASRMSYCEIGWNARNSIKISPENLLRGGGLRCTKATQSSMIPSHMFTEHQRSEMRAAGGLVASGITVSHEVAEVAAGESTNYGKEKYPAWQRGWSTVRIVCRRQNVERLHCAAGRVLSRQTLNHAVYGFADVAKPLGGVSKRIFRRGQPLLKPLSAAKASRTTTGPVRCDGAHTNAGA
ncbi:hypothetical protein ALC56_09273 [Trachymyrmex septentrionalis]|uniref:Uncharacterized protein n=1 Tax=Trachymyrmex septentrionalis TaxID=34720 RepID=A0A195F795_9HYME|nr:hypothetical protein ALC56_09273 [Trachymyrmex septentrionalis]